MNKPTLIILAALILTLAAYACASDKGDAVNCPVCDNTTQLLVGTACVPIAEIAACGPDGHAHGEECHCFGGQAPTTINNLSYCLQASCGDNGEEEDVDAHACEAMEEAGEALTAADAFANFDEAHAELGTLILLTLPEGKPGFVHFAAAATGDYAVYLDNADAFEKALDAEGRTLETESLGANPDCASLQPALYHVLVTNETGQAKPQILQFKTGAARTLRLFIHEAGAEHEHD